MRKIILFIALAASFSNFFPRPGIAQDFHRSYTIPAGGQIRIGNISGNVKLIGYGGATIEVAAYKLGSDRNLVEVEDNSAGDRIDLRAHYLQSHSGNASLNFEVRVPQSMEYNYERLSSVSGNIEVSHVTGRLRAESVSGNIDVLDVSGLVSAGSVSGNVNVDITRLQGNGDMKFSSVSGNVSVKAPASLDANIGMSSLSGSLKTDFPVDVQERPYGPGRSARGRLGSGTRSLRITSVSGQVSLIRK